SFTMSRKRLLAEMSFLLFVVACFIPDTAHAGYLDPGSGSILVQGILAVLAFFGRLKAKVKALFGFDTKGE
ncbi:hypothetical protein LJC59_07500, partial [Desulfovibrio sp. OttesenSCG-928-A18]|nr:hypothetical protein [Desulfovibrio sp. OttesenSCG-928-A18]